MKTLLLGVLILGFTTNYTAESASSELLAREYCYKLLAKECAKFQECVECSDDDDICDGATGSGNQTDKGPNVGITYGEYGQCVGNGVITGVALQSDPDRILYKSCHDKALWTTYWTLHQIDGTKPSENLIPEEVPSDFDRFPYHESDTLLSTYVVANQVTATRKLLTAADEYFTQHAEGPYCWFAKGHLLPCPDMNTKDERKATYNLINVFPQWQGINNRNWRKVENRVRKRSKLPLPKVQWVSTGIYGSLVLPDIPGGPEMKQVWLNVNAANVGDKNPAPMYVWKVVYDEDLAIVTINSMHIETGDIEHLVFCPDVCENPEYDWLIENFDRQTKGV